MNSLYDALIAPHARNDAPFLIPDQGTPLTYAAFVRRAAQMAHVLQNAGVTAGDRVLVQAPKTTDMVTLRQHGGLCPAWHRGAHHTGRRPPARR